MVVWLVWVWFYSFKYTFAFACKCIFRMQQQVIFHCQACPQRQLPSQCHKGQAMTVNSSSSHFPLLVHFPHFTTLTFYASKLHWGARRALGALAFTAACDLPVTIWGPAAKRELLYRNVLHPFPNTTSCDWWRVSMQNELPEVCLNLCFLFVRLNSCHKPSGGNTTIYIFPKCKYSHG